MAKCQLGEGETYQTSSVLIKTYLLTNKLLTCLYIYNHHKYNAKVMCIRLKYLISRLTYTLFYC